MADESVESRVEILDFDEFMKNERPVSIGKDVNAEISREESKPLTLYSTIGWCGEEAPYFP